MAHGPEPGTILNEGEPTEPRQAATVIVLRGGAERLEVLMVRRTPKARFMGGAWVFPGGAVDASEGHRGAAVREVAVRFDTWFFLARAPEGQEAEPDGQETVDARWFAPARALEGGEAGDLLLVFPTIKNLERLARFASTDDLLAWASTHEVKPSSRAS